MTKKRFYHTIEEYTDGKYSIYDGGSLNVNDIIDILNKVLIENEQLKFQLNNTSSQRDEFYHGARENANRIGELKKENKRLKEKIKDLELINDGLKYALTKIKEMCVEIDIDD